MTRVDPVCGMTVVKPGSPRTEFNHVQYHFCCEMCRGAFLERPGRYLKIDWREDQVFAAGEARDQVGKNPAEDS
ncbi:MAG: YHS domain-containing protein [Thermoanaerobaculales bacterium]